MAKYIYGYQPVREVLRHRPEQVEQIMLSREQSHSREIIALAQKGRIQISFLPRPELERLAGTREHQGALALAPLPESISLEDLLEKTQARPDSLLVFLDQIEDPQNLGAIIRTAECAGADGVIIPERRSAGVTPSVLKACSGALEYIPLAIVTNLAAGLEKVKQAGYWIYAAEAEAEKTLWETEFSPKSALVIGSEGKGIRPLVAKSSDFPIRIPQSGKIESLNASASAAVLIFEYRRQRSKK